MIHLILCHVFFCYPNIIKTQTIKRDWLVCVLVYRKPGIGSFVSEIFAGNFVEFLELYGDWLMYVSRENILLTCVRCHSLGLLCDLGSILWSFFCEVGLGLRLLFFQ